MQSPMFLSMLTFFAVLFSLYNLVSSKLLSFCLGLFFLNLRGFRDMLVFGQGD